MQWNDIDKTRQRDDTLKLRIGTWWSHFPRPMQEILRLEIMHLCHNLCRFCGILYWLSNSPWSFKSRVNSCVSKYTKDPQKWQKFTNSDFQTHFGYMFFQFLHMFGPLWILTGTMMQRTFFIAYFLPRVAVAVVFDIRYCCQLSDYQISMCVRTSSVLFYKFLL